MQLDDSVANETFNEDSHQEEVIGFQGRGRGSFGRNGRPAERHVTEETQDVTEDHPGDTPQGDEQFYARRMEDELIDAQGGQQEEAYNDASNQYAVPYHSPVCPLFLRRPAMSRSLCWLG